MGPTEYALIALGFALGGMLKGATGVGVPILAVPVMAMLVDVSFAVTVIALPSVVSNIWQFWRFRQHLGRKGFVASFALSGGVGIIVGTWLLASLPADILTGAVGVIVLIYVAFRLLNPHWQLSRADADRLVLPFGFTGGALQGVCGISAPASITFLNAIRMDRPEFVGTISVFFFVISSFQIGALWQFQLLTGQALLISTGAIFVILAAMPLGGWAARRVTREMFDRIILVLLTAIAIRLLAIALW